jgi:hypothetical protein
MCVDSGLINTWIHMVRLDSVRPVWKLTPHVHSATPPSDTLWLSCEWTALVHNVTEVTPHGEIGQRKLISWAVTETASARHKSWNNMAGVGMDSTSPLCKLKQQDCGGIEGVSLLEIWNDVNNVFSDMIWNRIIMRDLTVSAHNAN